MQKILMQLPSGHWICRIRKKSLSCLHKMCNLTKTSNIYKQNRPSYILRSIISKITTSIHSFCFSKKRHFTISVLVLQCLLRLLIIFSYYMKSENIFARIFSKVESLQQQKVFTIRSLEITTKCFWQKN